MKRFVFSILCVMIIITSVCGCDSSTSEEQELLPSNYLIFKTGNTETYLNFLAELDASDTFEIVDISNSTYSYKYAKPIYMYTVTYKICDTPKEEKIEYSYSIFETENENEYLSFLESFNYEECKIVDMSVTTYAGEYNYNNTFIITYGQKI